MSDRLFVLCEHFTASCQKHLSDMSKSTVLLNSVRQHFFLSKCFNNTLHRLKLTYQQHSKHSHIAQRAMYKLDFNLSFYIYFGAFSNALDWISKFDHQILGMETKERTHKNTNTNNAFINLTTNIFFENYFLFDFISILWYTYTFVFICLTTHFWIWIGFEFTKKKKTETLVKLILK